MAQKISHAKMSNHGLLGVHFPQNPFTEKEINELTGDMKYFSLTHDGDNLFLWGADRKKRPRKFKN